MIPAYTPKSQPRSRPSLMSPVSPTRSRYSDSPRVSWTSYFHISPWLFVDLRLKPTRLSFLSFLFFVGSFGTEDKVRSRLFFFTSPKLSLLECHLYLLLVVGPASPQILPSLFLDPLARKLQVLWTVCHKHQSLIRRGLSELHFLAAGQLFRNL